jgi:hypothetical protein
MRAAASFSLARWACARAMLASRGPSASATYPRVEVDSAPKTHCRRGLAAYHLPIQYASAERYPPLQRSVKREKPTVPSRLLLLHLLVGLKVA